MSKKKEEQKDCAICLDGITDDLYDKYLPCGHLFHPKCSRNYIATAPSKDKTCPLCRTVIASVVRSELQVLNIANAVPKLDRETKRKAEDELKKCTKSLESVRNKYRNLKKLRASLTQRYQQAGDEMEKCQEAERVKIEDYKMAKAKLDSMELQ